jgi:hypothetical protein
MSVVVGNSLRSDIYPALDVGCHAVYIPNGGWDYDKVPTRSGYIQLTELSELLGADAMGYPRSIEDAVSDLASRLTHKQLAQIAEFDSADNFAGTTHMTYGLFCRNNYGLFGENQALYRETEARHPRWHIGPDDVSGEILRELYDYAVNLVEAGA